jgi:hypothetical protein
MKRKILAVILAGAGLCLVFLGSCRPQPSVTDYVESLPELPQEIAATLDPKTLATKVSVTLPAPEITEPGTALAPCCGSKDLSSLKVRYAYTKCGLLRDFILAPFRNLLLSEKGGPGGETGGQTGDFKAYKLSQFNRRPVLDQTICVTSKGPWNATLAEDKSCSNSAASVQTLLIDAFGNLVQFVWVGGVEFHPPEVELVSCRADLTYRFSCKGHSTCPCESIPPCAEDQPCDCGIAGQW